MQLLGVALGDRYRLDRLLGQGAMAAVVRATDLLLGREVAVKVIHPRMADDPTFLARFFQEAQAAAAVVHPNAVAVYDFGEHQGTPFIVLELVTGEPLSEFLAREGPLPPARAVMIASGICEALDAAHSRGLVHRDIKPGNVMIGPGDTVKVMDFGLARPAELTSGLTETGMVVGTAHYISPEQARGLPAQPTSDLYAVAVCLYEMLAGRRPFSGTNPAKIAIQHVSDLPRPLDEYRPALPPALVAAVHQGLAKQPENRQPTAAALRRCLEEALAAPHPRAVESPVREPGEPTLLLPAVSISPPGPDHGHGIAIAGNGTRMPRASSARRRWLAGAALVVFVAVSATMLSLRADPRVAPPVADDNPSSHAPVALPPPQTGPRTAAEPGHAGERDRGDRDRGDRDRGDRDPGRDNSTLTSSQGRPDHAAVGLAGKVRNQSLVKGIDHPKAEAKGKAKGEAKGKAKHHGKR